MDPNSLPPQGPLEVVPAMNTIERVNVETPTVPTVMCATDAQVATQEIAATNAPATPTDHHPKESTNVKVYSNSLPTPILINVLQHALTDHPDQNFVSQICSNLGSGARIGYDGQRSPRFSRNLPTALADPDVVTKNLMHEIS